MPSQTRTNIDRRKTIAAEAAFDSHCYNCCRGLCVNGAAAVCRDAGHLFCSHNCRWAFLLDVKESRIRVAKRAKEKKPLRKRKRVRPVFRDDDSFVDDEHVDSLGGDGGNAMFGYHVCLAGELDISNGGASVVR